MRVVLRPGARLPNAFVRLIPIVRDVLADVDQHLLRGPVEVVSVKRELRGGIHHFAVNIELHLVARGVADAYRAGIAVSAQVMKLALCRRMLAEDRVEDAEL